jgi:hypothetical protein
MSCPKNNDSWGSLLLGDDTAGTAHGFDRSALPLEKPLRGDCYFVDTALAILTASIIYRCAAAARQVGIPDSYPAPP